MMSETANTISGRDEADVDVQRSAVVADEVVR